MPLSDDTQLLILGLVALAVLTAALAALVLLRVGQRRLVAEFRAGLTSILAPDVSVRHQRPQIEAFTATLGCDKVRPDRPRVKGEPLQKETQVSSPEQGPVEPNAGPRAFSELGDRVAAVLEAAEQAAEQMRGDAEKAAEQLTRQAEQEAKTRLEEATSEAARVRAEADRESKNTREAVELYATNHRREAEEQVARMLSEAEVQARASREAAEAMAQRIEESARTLEEELREQDRVIRGRMQRYLAALRDVSGQIEEVLGEPIPQAEPARPEPAGPEPARPEPQTLVSALQPERAKEEQG